MNSNLLKFIGVAFLAVPMLASAADTYVSTTGSDSNDGLSPATPKLTVFAAAQAASAGDTINVAAGTYSGAGNVNLDWNAVQDRSIVGAGPTLTIFNVTDNDRFLNRLETQTMNPLFASFKVTYSNPDNWNCGGFGWGDGGQNFSATFSNLWLQGPYDGDQTVATDGTDGKRNGAAFFSNTYGDGVTKYYEGTATISYCLISGWGRSFAMNDYGYTGGDKFLSIVFDNCTFANNADTGAGYKDGSMIWLRGPGAGRSYFFNNCVISHNDIDTGCATDLRIISSDPVENVITMDNNLVYLPSLVNGAEAMVYSEPSATYVNKAGDTTDVDPAYTTYNGKPYSLADSRGWSTAVPEPAMGFIALAMLALGLVRKFKA